jgi:two-component system phosphate regulon response regulator PhoB
LASDRKRILLVDDDQQIHQLVRIILSRIGAETLSAENAASAAQVLRQGPMPDLLILDLMLPDISGLEFLRQLRAKRAFDDLPVLVLSALVDSENIREALNSGADRYLTKPYIPSNLIVITQDMLRTGRTVRS